MSQQDKSSKLTKQDSAWSAILGDEDFDESDVKTVKLASSPFVVMSGLKKDTNGSSTSTSENMARTPSKPSILGSNSPFGRVASSSRLESVSKDALAQLPMPGSQKNELKPTLSTGLIDFDLGSTDDETASNDESTVRGRYESDTIKRVRGGTVAAAVKGSDDDLADVVALSNDTAQRTPLKLAFFDTLSSNASSPALSLMSKEERYNSLPKYELPPAPSPLSPVKSPSARPTIKAIVFDDPELAEMMALSEESSAVRKPLQLGGGDPSMSISSIDRKSSPLESKTTSTSSLSTPFDDTVQLKSPGAGKGAKKPLKQNLTGAQVDDLQSFLNDDEYEDQVLKEADKKGAIFGSFSPEAVGASGKENNSDIPKDLVELDFSYGQELPVKNWGLLIASSASTLETICFAHNNLQSLPEKELEMATKLKTLDLSFNKLEKIPRSISHLEQLQSLEMRLNMIKTAGPFSSSNSKLEKLILYKNLITTVDDSISKLTHLRTIDLSSNRFSEFPRALLSCPSLEKLDVSGNQISVLSVNLQMLSRLASLNLGKNKITAIHADFSLPESIEELDLSSNKLAKFSSNLFEGRLKLRVLNIPDNSLTEVPSILASAESIEVLDIRKNAIDVIPSALCKLTRLEALLVDTHDDSMIRIPPVTICRQGTEAIMTYLGEVHRGVADAQNSMAYGSGLSPSCVACEKESFTIKAIDRLEQQKRSGGDLFEVEVNRLRSQNEGVESVSSNVEDHQDGTYTAYYDASRAGNYLIHVRVAGAPIAKSPFRIEISPQRVSASRSFCEGAGLKAATAGEKETFIVKSCDQFKNAAVSGGADVLIKSDVEDSSFSHEVQDLQNGSYEVNYTCSKSGSIKLRVILDGDEVHGSPYTVDVKAAALDQKKSSVSSSSAVVAEKGASTSFLIYARDGFGNPRLTGDDVFEAHIRGQDGHDVPTTVKHCSNTNEYLVSYILPSVGKYRVEVSSDRAAVGGTPFEITAIDGQESQLSQIQHENRQLTLSLAQAHGRIAELEELVKSLKSATVSSTRSAEYHVTFDFNSEDESKLIEHLVTKMGPYNYFVHPIPARIVYLCALTKHTQNSDHLARGVLMNFISAMQSETGKDGLEVDCLVFWLANTFYLLGLIESNEWMLSGDSALDKTLKTLCDTIYRTLIKSMQNSLSPVVVTALVSEASSKVETYRSKGRGSFTNKFRTALESVFHCLTSALASCHKYLIPDDVIHQIFGQVFYFMDAVLMNSLLLRKKLCNVDNANRIKINLASIEEWMENNHLMAISTSHKMNMTRAAVELLKLPLSQMTSSDAEGLVKMTLSLNYSQIEKLLRNAVDDLNDALLSAVRQQYTQEHSDETASDQLFLDTFLTQALKIPSILCIDEVTIPESFVVPYVRRGTVNQH